MARPKSALYLAMQSSQRYADERDILDNIHSMIERVAEGEDPEDVLQEEGFEPDYVFDLLD